jgi:hypothetical protein
MQTAQKIISLMVVCALFTITFSACVVYKKPSRGYSKGPPPWAPAYGYRVRYQYRYYPSYYVYFDVKRSLYFYRSGNVWIKSYKLPPTIVLNVNNYVTLTMGVDKPYKFHHNVVKRYPPGLNKKKYKNSVKDKKRVIYKNSVNDKERVIYKDSVKDKKRVLHKNSVKDKKRVLHKNSVKDKKRVTYKNNVNDKKRVNDKKNVNDEKKVKDKKYYKRKQ